VPRAARFGLEQNATSIDPKYSCRYFGRSKLS
jgi:hypothetical protein